MTNVPVSSKKFSVVRSMTALKRTLKPPGQSGGLLTGVKYEPLDTTTVSRMICGPSARAAAATASAAIAQNKIRVIPRMVMLLSGWFGLAAGSACAAPASRASPCTRRARRRSLSRRPAGRRRRSGCPRRPERAGRPERRSLTLVGVDAAVATNAAWRRQLQLPARIRAQSRSRGSSCFLLGLARGWRVAGPAHHLLGEDQLHRKRPPFSGRNLEAALGCLFVDLLDERQPSEPVVVEQTLFDQDRHACTYGERERVAGTSVDLLAVHEDSRVERVV